MIRCDICGCDFIEIRCMSVRCHNTIHQRFAWLYFVDGDILERLDKRFKTCRTKTDLEIHDAIRTEIKERP